MTKALIEFEQDSKEGKALLAMALAFRLTVADVKEDKEQENCPILRSTIFSTNEQIMNFQQNIRCRLQNVHNQLTEVNKVVKLIGIPTVERELSAAIEHTTDATSLMLLHTRKLIKVNVEKEDYSGDPNPTFNPAK